jgi:diguanylate cyclase (GGDEF)-like protein
MFDLDGFKIVNDTHGHLVGDEILRTFGGILKGVSREGDFCCRYAGDEFVVVLAGADAAAAASFSRRVRDKLAEQDCSRISTGIDVSIGSATWPGDGSDPSRLLSAADERMYSDKFGRRSGMGPPRRADAVPTIPSAPSAQAGLTR